MQTLTPGSSYSVTLQPGEVLSVSPDLTALTVVYRYLPTVGGQSNLTSQVVPGTEAKFGPYQSAFRFVVTVSRGGASVDVNQDDVELSVQRVGVVATKCIVPASNSATNRQIMSRTPHVALQNITEMSTVWGNWYAAVANVGELATVGNITLRAAVEYPLGTIAGVFTWGGSQTTTILPFGTSVTDTLKGLNIPAGAVFAIRNYQVGQSGLIFTTEGAGNSILCAQFGVSGIADVTYVGGSFTDQQPGIAYWPAAIIAPTTAPTLALTGDSRAFGVNDLAADLYAGRGIFERAVSKRFGYIRMASSGEHLRSMLEPKFARRKELIDAYCTHIVSNYGINDMNGGGRTGEQVLADLSLAFALYKKPWIHATVSPFSTSTDSYATTANQTTNATVNPRRVVFNTAIRSGAAGVSGYLEIADAVEEVRDNGKWKANGTANLWTSDGVHESTFACQQIEANQNIFAPLNLIR